jgi:hypothetical protein
MPLIDKQAAADGDEAAMEDDMAAEVDEAADANSKMIMEAGEGIIISKVSTLLTLTEASRGTNGIHWDPKDAPPCYLCETELRTEAAAPVVDVMEATEDAFPCLPTATMSALSERQSSNTMPMPLQQLRKMMTRSPNAEEGTAMALAAAPMYDGENICK